MRKIVLLLLTFLFSTNSVLAISIDKTLDNLGVNKNAVSVSVREVKSGDSVYCLNCKTPKSPASTLKLVTTPAVTASLGKDFKYVTTLYKSTNNDLYLKLSGDPLLLSGDLGKLIQSARIKNIVPKKFYIDDFDFDKTEWGEGWQWDDELNPLMPKFSIYNLDYNMLKIELTPLGENMAPKVSLKSFYPISFVNLLKTDTTSAQGVNIEKSNSIAPNMYNLSGIVNKKTDIDLPVPSPKLYFTLRLKDAIRNKKLDFYSDFKSAKVPGKNVYVVDKIEHEIEPMILDIYKNSNNLYVETLFKTYGINSNGQDNRTYALSKLDKFLNDLGVNSEDVNIVDASGVSKNNLVTSDFMTDLLQALYNKQGGDEFAQMLPAPGEGTLRNRMLYFKGFLNAKTGTLSDTSAIAGYLTSKRGKLYAFDIMICDSKTTPSEKKNIEEQILRNIYINY